tara:strand:+ start:577 stop:1200 length:624 start_codon:yes stop_codon:yes gene_type:complete
LNNIELTIKFIKENSRQKLIINRVNEEIGLFYINLIEKEAIHKNTKVNYKDQFVENSSSDLFIDNEIDLCVSNNKKDIEKFLNSNNKSIIFTDYKNFKIYSKSALNVNGYNYINDIKHYITKILNINNPELIDFCINSPYLTFSELSKYLINSSSYIRENKIKESNNFILEIRKELFNIKRNQGSPKDIYLNLKKEVLYKKLNFLVY